MKKLSRTCLFAVTAAALSIPSVVQGSAGDPVSERGMLSTPITVPSSVLTTIGTLLPERSLIAPNLVSSAFDPNLRVTAPANVWVTFLHEGAGNRNTLGYFTYRVDDSGVLTIVDRQLILPNASFSGSGGTLISGDQVMLRDAAGAVRVFQAGDRIGFFLVGNGWTGTGVRGWDPAAPTLPSTNPATNATNSVYTTIDGLNPENANGRSDVCRHFATISMAGMPGFLAGTPFTLIGVEDLRRDGGSDNDFNDLVFVAQGNPITAVSVGSAPTYDPVNPDPDGDGVTGIDDAFPNDPNKAFLLRTPVSGWQTMVFEDTYPSFGDADYNDAVVQFAWERVLNAAGQVVELEGTFHLIARGASLDHSFGVAMRGLPAGITGTSEIEHFATGGLETREAPHAFAAIGDHGGTASALRFEIFGSTRTALPKTNTDTATPATGPASARIVIKLASPIAATTLGLPPFDPYLTVHPADVTIHLAGTTPFDDDTVTEVDATHPYLTAAGQPWAMVVPYDFRYPLERKPITTAYPTFSTWRASHGTSATTWYQSPYGAAVVNKFADTVRARPWTLAVVN